MIFLIGLGALLTQHVPPGWRQKDQRPSGVSLLVVCGILAVSGWGLYYLGNELYRHWTSTLHWVLGALLPVILAVHVWLAHRRIR